MAAPLYSSHLLALERPFFFSLSLCRSLLIHRKTKKISMLKLNPIKIHWLFRNTSKLHDAQRHRSRKVIRKAFGNDEEKTHLNGTSQHHLFMRDLPFVNFICFLLSFYTLFDTYIRLWLAHSNSRSFDTLNIRKAIGEEIYKKKRKKYKSKESLNRKCVPIYQVLTWICLKKLSNGLELNFFVTIFVIDKSILIY